MYDVSMHAVCPSRNFLSHVIQSVTFANHHRQPMYPALFPTQMDATHVAHDEIDLEILYPFAKKQKSCNQYTLEDTVDRDSNQTLRVVRLPELNRVWVARHTNLDV